MGKTSEENRLASFEKTIYGTNQRHDQAARAEVSSSASGRSSSHRIIMGSANGQLHQASGCKGVQRAAHQRQGIHLQQDA